MRYINSNATQDQDQGELNQCVPEEWGKVSTSYLKKIIASISGRCFRVLKKLGKKTDYQPHSKCSEALIP